MGNSKPESEKTGIRENQLKAIAEAVEESVLLLERDGTVIEANTVAAHRLGVSRKDLLGSFVWRFMPRGVAESRIEAFQRVLQTGESVQAEDVRNGKTYQTTWYPVLNESKMVHQVAVVGRDITHRKRREDQLEEKETLFRGIFEASPIGIALIESESQRFIRANQSFCNILGYTEKELCGLTVKEVAYPENWYHEGDQVFSDVDKEYPVYSQVKRYIRKDGEIRWIHVNGRPLTRREKNPRMGIAMVEDISEQRQAVEALKESEHKYRLLVENAQDAIYVLQDGVITFANSSTSRLTGYANEVIVGRPFTEFLHPEDRVNIQKRYEDRLAGREVPTNYKLPVIHKSGRDVWVQVNQIVVNWEGAPATLNIARDITGEHTAEVERKRLLSAIEQAAEVIVITDREGNIQYVNPSFEKVTGYTCDEVMGRNPRILKSGVQDTAFYREMWQSILSGQRWQGRMVNRRKDGTHYTEEASISPVTDDKGKITHFVAVKRDVTAEVETENRLAQAQRMESIGNLAGGVAHDFNNILSPIIIHSEMAMMELPDDSPLQMSLTQIYQAGERARDLVQQILTFARREEKERIPLRASLIVKEAIKFLRATIPTTIDIQYDIQAEQDIVLADPSQMHQVVMNLCTNAAHAMREKGGKLEVRLTDEHLGKEETSRFIDLSPGHYLRISVRDTGTGISPELIDRIFEPYFTTKEVSEGTGLGLAVTHGIVKRYEGGIAVESEVGKGTVFHVMLPIIDAAISPVHDPKTDLPEGNERILLVDDEQSAVAAIQPMLEKLGYEVTARTSSREALTVFQDHPGAFDLVITDYTMPEMTGRDLAAEVMRLRPDIPIILCTGFSEQIDEAKAKAMGIRAFVIKPVVMKEMARTIREVLEL